VINKHIKILLFFLFISVICKAEYFPIFSQYVSNGLVINPAYSGSREVLSLNLMYRNQWVGLDGAPTYQTFSIHAPLKNAHIGLGLLFLNENSGLTQNTHAYFNYAYRIRMGKGKLALGLKAGVQFSKLSSQHIFLNDDHDPAFDNYNNYFVIPNVGAGVYYYSPHAFLGFSVPYLLSYKANNSNSGYLIYNDFSNYNYLFTCGYLFDISKGFKIKPSALLKYNEKLQQQFDLNLNLILFNDKLWIGGAYREKEAITGMFELQLNPQLRLGYSFDYSGAKMSTINYVSHEITLRYEFSYKIKAFNPRYF